MAEERKPDVVIGVGNPLMADDGIGIAAVARLRAAWGDPQFDGLELIDGGTWGMNLLPLIETAGRLMILDAIDQAQAPGSLIVLRGSEVPRYMAIKLSPHQIDLREVLALAELRGTLPAETMAIGLQPERVELGFELSHAVESRFDDLLNAAADQLEVWGHRMARPARSWLGSAHA